MPVVVPAEAELRRLVLVLGDQLHDSSPALAGIDPARDRVLMIEAPGEARVVWSHRARIALFLAAMRHHAAALADRGIPVDYVRLDDPRHAAGQDGLVERLAAPSPCRAATYERADAAPVAGDRRRRRRAKEGPWRGRFVDILG